MTSSLFISNSKEDRLAKIQKAVKLNKEAQPIYDCIAENIQISLDDLSEKLEIPPFKLLPILLDLELKSYIKALSGKQYRIS